LSHSETDDRVEHLLVVVAAGNAAYVPQLVPDPRHMPLDGASVAPAQRAGKRLDAKFRRWGITGGQAAYATGERTVARSTLTMMLTRVAGVDAQWPQPQLLRELDGEEGSTAEVTWRVIERLARSAPRITKPSGFMTVTVIVGDRRLLDGMLQYVTEGQFRALHPDGLREGHLVPISLTPDVRHPRRA